MSEKYFKVENSNVELNREYIPSILIMGKILIS